MSQFPTSTSAGSFRMRLCDSLIPSRALPGPAKPNKPADGQPGRTEQKDVAENFFRKRDDVLEPSQALPFLLIPVNPAEPGRRARAPAGSIPSRTRGRPRF